MKNKPASRDSSAAVSGVWWPDSGSITCAIDAPLFMSMIWPATSKAHSTAPNSTPITAPRKTSLPNRRSQSTEVKCATSTAGCSATDSAASARKIALRTSAGMVSCVNSGSSMNATAMRVADRASTSTCDDQRSTCSSASIASSGLVHHAGKAREHAIGELVEPAAQHRGSDEDGGDDGEELERVLQRLFLDLRARLQHRDDDADDGRHDDGRRRQQHHVP